MMILGAPRTYGDLQMHAQSVPTADKAIKQTIHNHVISDESAACKSTSRTMQANNQNRFQSPMPMPSKSIFSHVLCFVGFIVRRNVVICFCCHSSSAVSDALPFTICFYLRTCRAFCGHVVSLHLLRRWCMSCMRA